MRRLLPGCALAALLASTAALTAACGDAGSISSEPASQGTSPAGSSTGSPATAGPVEHRLVAMLTETAVGGEVGQSAALPDEAAVAAYAAGFTGPAMGERLRAAYDGTRVPDGSVAYASVVSVGCDAPTDVSVGSGPTGLEVAAVPVTAPQRECFAPMTTVALVLVPVRAL